MIEEIMPAAEEIFADPNDVTLLPEEEVVVAGAAVIIYPLTARFVAQLLVPGPLIAV